MTDSVAKILIVEDDVTLAGFLETLLTQENYEVRLAADGPSGLEMARREKPHLVLLDVLLPGMNGFEVCQRFRQDPQLSQIPVLLVTALSALKDRVTGLKLGADEFIPKPFDALELLARVERALTRSRRDIAVNPLTGLPGRAALDGELYRRFTEKIPFILARANIEGLKFYNESYGFAKGDHVIRLMALVLQSASVELGDRNDVVTHLGGDYFVWVGSPARAEVVAARALENADLLVPLQYNDEDRRRGYCRRQRNDGIVERPFLRLTVGLLDVPAGKYDHPAPLLDALKDKISREPQGPSLQRLPA